MTHRVSAVIVALAILVCTFWSPTSATSQVVVVDFGPPTSCVTYIYKLYSPDQMSPTFVGIAKSLSSTVMCTPNGGANASCSSSFMAPYFFVSATAIGTQISMSPTCSWNCGTVCGTITINSVNDGLPVELMDFSIE